MNNQAIDDMVDVLMWLLLAPKRMYRKVNEQLDSIYEIQTEIDTLDNFCKHAAYINFPIDYTIQQLYEQVLNEKSPIDLSFVYECEGSNRLSTQEKEITLEIASLANDAKNMGFDEFLEILNKVNDTKASQFAERLNHDIDTGTPISMKTFIEVYDIGGKDLTDEQLKVIQKNQGKNFLEWSKDDAKILGIVDFTLTNESPLRQYNKTTANDILNKHSQEIQKAKFGTIYNTFSNEAYNLKEMATSDIFKRKMETLEENKFFTTGSGFERSEDNTFQAKLKINMTENDMTILDDFMKDGSKNNILEIESDKYYVEIRKYQGQLGNIVDSCLKVDICEKCQFNNFLVETIDTSFVDKDNIVSIEDIKEKLLEKIPGEASVSIAYAIELTKEVDEVKNDKEVDAIKEQFVEKLYSNEALNKRDAEIDKILDSMNISDNMVKFSPEISRIEFCKNIETKNQSEILDALKNNLVNYNDICDSNNVSNETLLTYFNEKIIDNNNEYLSEKTIYDEVYKMDANDITKSTLDNNMIKYAFEDIALSDINNSLDKNGIMSGIEAKTYFLGEAIKTNPELFNKDLKQYNDYQLVHGTKKEVNLSQENIDNIVKDTNEISEKIGMSENHINNKETKIINNQSIENDEQEL